MFAINKLTTAILLLASGLCATSSSHAGPPMVPPTPISPPATQLPATQLPATEKSKELEKPYVDIDEKMFPDGLYHDFGAVAMGTRLPHVVRIVNTFDVPLRIVWVRVSMNPSLSARSTKEELQPGEEGSVLIAMDTRNFLGPKTTNLYITMDNGKSMMEARLTLRANSRDDIDYSQVLDFGKIQHGATPIAQMTVKIRGNPMLRVTEARSESSHIHVQVQQLARGKTDTLYQVTATPSPDLPEGRWYSNVQLSTNDPAMPRIFVPVSITVEPR